jgi:vacuolar-type H+-ATPase subunit I/STV1
MCEHGIDIFIELIEECPCENVEHFRKREGELIRQSGTLNKKIEGRSKSEYMKIYDATHKEQNEEKRRRYIEKNRDQILERRRELRQLNSEQKKKQDKIYYNKNKDKIYERTKEWKSQKVNCQCGGCYTHAHKAEHIKSKRHQQYLNSAEQ